MTGTIPSTAYYTIGEIVLVLIGGAATHTHAPTPIPGFSSERPPSPSVAWVPDTTESKLKKKKKLAVPFPDSRANAPQFG